MSSNPDTSKEGGRDLAYALYVLARNGVAPGGDLRYIADTKINDLSTPIAKAQVAAALAMLGDQARADRVYLAALNDIAPQPKLQLGRADFGSALRDSIDPISVWEKNATSRMVTLPDTRLRLVVPANVRFALAAVLMPGGYCMWIRLAFACTRNCACGPL